MRTVVVSGVMVAVLFAVAPGLFASEADELREKAQAMKKEAVELQERGRVDAAEALARKANELMEFAARSEKDRPKVSPEEIEKLKGVLKDMIAKERKMKESGASGQELAEMQVRIAKTEQEIAKLHALRGGPSAGRRGPKGPEGRMPGMAEQLEDVGRRVKHFRIAAENLRAAGADDIARQLMMQADEMERAARGWNADDGGSQAPWRAGPGRYSATD